MKRTVFLRVIAFLAVVGTACTTWAHGPSGSSSHGTSGNFHSGVQQTAFHAPVFTQPVTISTGGNNGPGKIGLGHGPVVPVKGGGTFTGPVGGYGPIQLPGGGVIGPSGPSKLPPGGGTTTMPPSSGTGNGSGSGNKGCKPWWPPIVIGCVPFGGYGGYYGGYYPVYTQTVIVPASTAVVAGPIVPVTAVASTENLPQVPVGSTLTLNAANLGSKGQTLLLVDKLTLGVQVDDWSNDHATVTLPALRISGPTKAEIVLVKADGYAASRVKVQLVPAPSQSSGDATGGVAAVVR